MGTKHLGKQRLKGNAKKNMGQTLRTSKDAVERLKLIQVEKTVPLKTIIASGWNNTAHVATVANNIAWKAAPWVALVDYVVQTVNSWEHGAKIFAGIYTGLTSVMHQIKPLVTWCAANGWETVGIVAGYIGLTHALKFRFKKAPAGSAANQK